MKFNIGDLIQIKARDNLPKGCVDCMGIVINVNDNERFTFYCRFLCLSSLNNNCARNHHICSCMKEDNTLVISQVK